MRKYVSYHISHLLCWISQNTQYRYSVYPKSWAELFWDPSQSWLIVQQDSQFVRLQHCYTSSEYVYNVYVWFFHITSSVLVSI